MKKTEEPPFSPEGKPTHRCCICNKVNRGNKVAVFGDFATCSDECGERYLTICTMQGRAMRALQAENKRLRRQIKCLMPPLGPDILCECCKEWRALRSDSAPTKEEP